MISAVNLILSGISSLCAVSTNSKRVEILYDWGKLLQGACLRVSRRNTREKLNHKRTGIIEQMSFLFKGRGMGSRWIIQQGCIAVPLLAKFGSRRC